MFFELCERDIAEWEPGAEDEADDGADGDDDNADVSDDKVLDQSLSDRAVSDKAMNSVGAEDAEDIAVAGSSSLLSTVDAPVPANALCLCMCI